MNFLQPLICLMQSIAIFFLAAYLFASVAERRFVHWREFLPKKKNHRK
ncbi:MAG: hypothetical protein NT098_04705 [Candidatus Parcubacteria bacterium]|nr:hypothetical protein [Candidatus Parcubacteria bacterium]